MAAAPKTIKMSQFEGGRNGEDSPDMLVNEKGYPTGQCAEQINIRTDRNSIENKSGERRKGDEISATGGIYGLTSFLDYFVAVHNTSLYILLSDGTTWSEEKTGLTANLPMTFIPYNDKLYCSNGTDTVFEIVETSTDNFTFTDRATIPKGLAFAEYGEKLWDGKITGLTKEFQYSVTATAGTPANFYDFSSAGSGIEFIADGGDSSALLNYRGNLLLSKKNLIKVITGFDDTTPPVPIKEEFDKTDGAINEDCLIKVGADVVYFTGSRFRKLFTSDFEGIQQDEGFDRPVLDILDGLDSDQSEACMVWNETTGLMFCSLKTKGSLTNNIRLVYSTRTNAWWQEQNVFARKYVVKNGITYYGHSIIGKVVQDNIGSTRDGANDISFYESRHVPIPTSTRFVWTHLYLEGLISPNTIITVRLYVDNALVSTFTVTESDINDIDALSEAVGDETIGDSTWGGGVAGEEVRESRRPFKKWMPIGRNGNEFYYTIETNGYAQSYKISSAEARMIPTKFNNRLQSTN